MPAEGRAVSDQCKANPRIGMHVVHRDSLCNAFFASPGYEHQDFYLPNESSRHEDTVVVLKGTINAKQSHDVPAVLRPPPPLPI